MADEPRSPAYARWGLASVRVCLAASAPPSRADDALIKATCGRTAPTLQHLGQVVMSLGRIL